MTKSKAFKPNVKKLFMTCDVCVFLSNVSADRSVKLKSSLAEIEGDVMPAVTGAA